MANLEVRLVDGGALIEVIGELDANTSPQLIRHLNGANSDVRLDLSGCSFMDSSGVSALVAAKSAQCPDLQVIALSRPVSLVLEVTGLDEVLVAPGVTADESGV